MLYRSPVIWVTYGAQLPDRRTVDDEGGWRDRQQAKGGEDSSSPTATYKKDGADDHRRDNLGIVLVAAMIVGAVLLVCRRRDLDILPTLSLLTIAPFFVIALAVGQRPLHLTQITGDLYNIRFGLLMIVPSAILVAYLVSLVPEKWGRGAVAIAALLALLPVIPGGPPGSSRFRKRRMEGPESSLAFRDQRDFEGVPRDQSVPARTLRRRSDPDRVVRQRVDLVPRPFPTSFQQEDDEFLAIKVCTTNVAGFSAESSLLVGSPENNLGPFLFRNGVRLSCLDYLIPESRRYSDSHKSEGAMPQ